MDCAHVSRNLTQIDTSLFSVFIFFHVANNHLKSGLPVFKICLVQRVKVKNVKQIALLVSHVENENFFLEKKKILPALVFHFHGRSHLVLYDVIRLLVVQSIAQ